MKLQTSSLFDRSSSLTSWPLLLLGLASCQAVPPVLEEASETGSTSADDPSSTSAVVDPDGTTSSTSSGIDPDGTTSSTSSGIDPDGTTSSATDGSTSDTSDEDPPSAPVLTLGFSQVKQFDFGWTAVAGADYYQLLESPAPGEPFGQIGEDVVGESISITVPLFARYQASYLLRACNAAGCTDSDPVDVTGSLATAVGYFKASNTGAVDWFGFAVALSEDGSTLAVGALQEDSSATGIDGDQTNESASAAGAVYVFVRDGNGLWSQQAYVKASNTDPGDGFGGSLALSSDGSTLAVGAWGEDSGATGIDGNQADDGTLGSGAVYVFERDAAGAWSQQAYVKASNTGAGDSFGRAVMLSGDGNTLAVAAPQEDSSATGIDGDQTNDLAAESGAVYVFERDGMSQWSQQAYIKASNTGADDRFGRGLALDVDGDTLAIGAASEAGDAAGIDGDQADDTAPQAGAVYVLVRDGMDQWSQQAYVKASNPDMGDAFGSTVALSADGDTLAVGALGEDSSASGVGGNQADDSLDLAGAVYVFVRDPMDQWSQQAYVKASNPDMGDTFGSTVALSSDGNTLAVAASDESSSASGIDGDQHDDTAPSSGAVYVLVRDAMGQWSQQAYVKASVADAADDYGWSIALSGDGHTLAGGSPFEDGDATGIGGNPSVDLLAAPGAVYLH